MLRHAFLVTGPLTTGLCNSNSGFRRFRTLNRNFISQINCSIEFCDFFCDELHASRFPVYVRRTCTALCTMGDCVGRDCSVGIAIRTGWTVRGSNARGYEIFRTRSDQPWGQDCLICNMQWILSVFPGGKAAWA